VDGKRGRSIPLETREKVIALIDQAVVNGARSEQACHLVGIHLRTSQRWSRDKGLLDKRTFRKLTPPNKLSAIERCKIISIVSSNEYSALPPCQIVPRLADKGLYVASEATFYRILREDKLLRHRQRSRPKSRQKPRELIAYGPNQVWCWDVTYLPSTIKGIFYYLYLVMDIFSRKIVGWTVQPVESCEHASWLFQDICRAEKIDKNQISLHSDNGAIMKGSTLLATLQMLGIIPSFSRPAVSNDNPYSEALFKTLKYCPEFPGSFGCIEDSRAFLRGFVNWYNAEHRHSGINRLTPESLHYGRAEEVIDHRNKVLEGAYARNPSRFKNRIPSAGEVPTAVWINPPKQEPLIEVVKEKMMC
jgi:transposase InsO family protein